MRAIYGTILEQALLEQGAKTSTFHHIVWIFVGLALLLPSYMLVSEFRADPKARHEYCREQRGFSGDLFDECMKKEGYSNMSCDGVEPSERWNVCMARYSFCRKNSISEDNISACMSSLRKEAFGRALGVATMPLLLIGFIYWLGRAQRRENQILRAALVPGALSRIEPYLLRILVSRVVASEKLVLRLHLLNGQRADLTLFDANKEENVITALMAQNPNCVRAKRSIDERK